MKTKIYKMEFSSNWTNLGICPSELIKDKYLKPIHLDNIPIIRLSLLCIPDIIIVIKNFNDLLNKILLINPIEIRYLIWTDTHLFHGFYLYLVKEIL